MNKVGFIGAYDKTDMILYVAKLLTIVDKKVLFVDTTITQKARYVVPAINPTLSYVTNFEGIDIAVGFRDLESIEEYLGKDNLDYEYLLIDIDSSQVMENFHMENAIKNYFVTSFDTYAIKRGLEALVNLKIPVGLTKVIYTKEILKEEDDYLNFLSAGYRIKWQEPIVYFPLEMGDQTAIMENQRLEKMKFKNLTMQYRDSLIYIAEEITQQGISGILKKALKAMERGAF